MYLKSLTARGFKSFADKITLEFEPGISVIVGPNGSGKSNVADAVLWVLGEQSPRNLRGTKMEDVIFAGSATRQPFNMAEVSLSIDNRDGGIPIEFPEVVVTRRMFRSGESEYFLNKTPCRLLDIQELLSDLGVGRELTAVISQNKLETILRSQSGERRAFIEEAAGLGKHRRRKEKALRKMEGMERNLLRVKDIMSEVSKQLRPLERQAKQAAEYRELISEIRDLSIRMLVAELRELRDQWENRRHEEEKLAAELEEKSSEIKEEKDRLGRLEARLRQLRQELEDCRDREMKLVSLGERLHSCERLGEERLRLYAALSGEMQFGESGWVSRRREAARKRAGLEEELKATEEDLAGLKKEEEGLLEERKSLEEELTGAGRERDGLRRSWHELEEKGREVRAGLEKVKRERREKEEALPALEEKGDSLREELEGLRQEIRSAEGRVQECRKRGAETEEKTAAAREDLARFREELEAIGRKQRRSFQEEAMVVARLRALQEVFSSRIDYASAAARIMEKGGDLPGIEGMLLHQINVEEEWERALESYLGPWLFCVVTRTLRDALEAIRFLKENEEGYGIFLPLSELDGREAEGGAIKAKTTVGTPAVDVVRCESALRPVLDYLLGEVVFCRSLEEAGQGAEAHPELTFVTGDGDVVSPRRAVKGGGRPRSPFHVIAQRREIEQLQEMLDLGDEESLSLEVQRKSALSTISGLEAELERLAVEGKEAEAELRRLELASQEMKIREERMRAGLEELSESIARLRKEEEELRGREAALEEEAARLARDMEDLKPGVAEKEAVVERLHRERKGLDEGLQELRARRASLLERRSNLEKRIRELSEEEEGHKPPSGDDLAAMTRLQEKLLALVRRLGQVHGKWEARLGESYEQKRREYSQGEGDLDEMRRRLEEMEAREGELREMLHNRDLAAAQLKMQVDMLVQRLLSEYKLPLETALTEYVSDIPREEMAEKLQALERRRDMLGQVNLRAPEEYDALKERHDFLVEQVEDLKESKASLLKVVRAIDREIVRIFKETFEEVNQHFQEIFEKLFPQGRAELVLCDPTELLNTGVDIEAQPRGKRLKKLSLLSGGETALASLAFLFAIFKTRPSPFYFLDEVEAALDDVNLHSFLDILKEFKSDSQLIVITHQKRTMEIADILYGVSMQASGVSRVVSQKLEEAERLAQSKTA